jgi:hypothetical protein
MASIEKTPYGTYRAVIKRGSKVATIKTFKRKTSCA